ncbi:type II toxin-antitoxin system HicA family toxin [Stenotrophomonas sp. YAU14D1_LEIMI4_1]|uniref:type II toxin-antitoxin system HicA family toxin n=1 Tax=Stenotrophomonas sp. YAU14D1_LEIMI4_1 TaxID=2072407 RepID=UPI002D797546|nr:type II toxin-antitoxin system HicA family toxin [Stenotrophomonas sp. YAU14D1_LEIMI4_1]
MRGWRSFNRQICRLELCRGVCTMCIVPGMKSGDLIRELREAGWTCCRIRGSHHVFVHPHCPHIVTVPHPRKDLGIGLVKAIRKLAGLK